MSQTDSSSEASVTAPQQQANSTNSTPSTAPSSSSTTPRSNRNSNTSRRMLSRAQRRQVAAQKQISKYGTEMQVIATHFFYDKQLYFVVYNGAEGDVFVRVRKESAKIAYDVKPFYYMRNTAALRKYYTEELNEEEKALIPADGAAISANEATIEKLPKRLQDVYTGIVTAAASNRRIRTTKKLQYTMHVPPKTWSHLARHRLENFFVYRVVCFARITTAGGGQPTKVYILLWQNEPCCELVPDEFIQKHSSPDKLQHNLEMALDYFEEAFVCDSRQFNSAFSIDKTQQSTTMSVRQTEDQFFINMVHEFVARRWWTDARGREMNETTTLYVNKCFGWRMARAIVSEDAPIAKNPDASSSEDDDGVAKDIEADDTDPPGHDEYLKLEVYDKFVFNANGVMIKAEKVRYEEFRKNRNVVRYIAHVPANWTQLAEQHAGEYEQVTIISVFRKSNRANVYLVKWPEYEYPTFVTSLILRKRHAKFMVEFFEKDAAGLPELEIEEK